MRVQKTHDHVKQCNFVKRSLPPKGHILKLFNTEHYGITDQTWQFLVWGLVVRAYTTSSWTYCRIWSPTPLVFGHLIGIY